MMRSILVVWVALLWPLLAGAQLKYEREYRVKDEEVPVVARSFIDSSFLGKSVKWYKEISLESASFEAKSGDYSIEFDTLGKIEDVEILLKWEAVGEGARTRIEQDLENTFTRVRVQKVQLQWTGSREALLALVRDKDTGLPYETRYELVVKGRQGRATSLYEVLFDEKGRRLGMSEIIPRNTDNLDY